MGEFIVFGEYVLVCVHVWRGWVGVNVCGACVCVCVSVCVCGVYVCGVMGVHVCVCDVCVWCVSLCVKCNVCVFYEAFAFLMYRERYVNNANVINVTLTL